MPSAYLSSCNEFAPGAAGRTRFPPLIRVEGLARRLKARQFVGFHEEDTLECQVLVWKAVDKVHVVLSPGRLSGHILAQQFERLASLYYLELLARGLVPAGESVCWIQHWPARQGAPIPYDADQFEQVLMTPWAFPIRKLPAQRRYLTDAEALLGLEPAPAVA